MKFYITKKEETRLLYRIIERFNYDWDFIENYDGNDGFFIITTNEVHDDYWKQYANKLNKLIYLLDDCPEGYGQNKRLEYTRFYDVLDEKYIDRKYGIICYNNAYNRGISYYKDFNLTTLYVPTFALWPFSEWKDVKTNITPEYDYSLLIRNGRKHKWESYLKVREKELDNILITYKENKEFDDIDVLDDVKDNLLDEFQFHLKPEVYLNCKIQITVESEYYPKKIPENPNYFEEILHLSEKSWRNISYGMSFVLISSKGSLAEIRRLGFKTFNNIVDESYDEMEDDRRISSAIDTAVELLKYHDTKEMNDIIEYNKSLIYDDSKMKTIFEVESLEPLKKYIKDLDN